MTNLEYLRNISAPRLAIVFGYVADTRPANREWDIECCCPLRSLGECGWPDYDCCETWAAFLMREMTPQVKAFWDEAYKGQIKYTQDIVDKAKKEKAGGTSNEDADTGVHQSSE